jgi:hypothetical protein
MSSNNIKCNTTLKAKSSVPLKHFIYTGSLSWHQSSSSSECIKSEANVDRFSESFKWKEDN